MHNLGAIKYILGIEIIRDRANRTMYLSQRKHVGDVLARFNMTDARPVSTPLAKSAPLTKEDCPQSSEDLEYMKSVPYLSAVGSLMYLTVGTCPDIAYAVGALSRFNANPGQAHWKQVQHVFKYLAATKDLMLCYGPGQDSTCLQIYSDVDSAHVEATALFYYISLFGVYSCVYGVGLDLALASTSPKSAYSRLVRFYNLALASTSPKSAYSRLCALVSVRS